MPGQMLRFAAIGIANTALGLSVIAAMLVLGVNDYAANAIGYCTGLILSIALNRSWTFGATQRLHLREAIGLLAIYAGAYALSLAVLTLMRAAGHQQSIVGQFAAMLTYSACTFIGLRMFTSKSADG